MGPEDAYDEARDAPAQPRPGYAETLGALAGTDLERLRGAVAGALERARRELRRRAVRRRPRAAADRGAPSGSRSRPGSRSARAR